MEVVIQSPSSPTMDNFDFGSNMGSIYHSVPSSPKGFGNYFLSAPTSPSRFSQLYSEFEYFSSTDTSSFEAANKTHDEEDKDDYSFAFSVSCESDKSSRSAEELFDGGRIKPLNESGDALRRGRGKEKVSSNSGRRVTRSHSPYRWEAEKQQKEQQQQQQQQQQPRINKDESSVLSSSSSSKGSSKRWWLRDLLLFRSASEGRGSSKDPLKKYYKKNGNEEVKGSASFRSSESSRRKGQSAHELHYAMKRAESEDMKKRTFLPYRQGILGRLAGFGI
ncbi:hypothetical protein PHAVU_001G019300 [Phaseolus vulgaris]|uniref:Calmodulin-binding protein n=1 Tax=Phaseolus vulgaris TaxID=3885 RepID=V7CRS3_PHAVU|nr:hypothetical protein PHAVU_001G019300g [Phaseolus vulgaris]ESW32814.1 hypothetical protein PHAVU_001G019300g [Phaseolus vulgaris]